uniref:Uncharacterized protein n=1 Tax=Acrobeloides nanus TaxID=290746 RepID=A0A914CD12_9BILA
MLAMLAMLITPFIVSTFRNEGDLIEWQNIFYVMATIAFISGMFFLLVGRCDVQEWAKIEQNKIQPQNNL